MTTLPKITNKQQEILQFLYRYRFLNRIQIQQFLRHKDKVRSSVWLKDLNEKQYINRIYDPNDFINKTKPAIYYLALNGIRYLRENGEYPPEELRKRYAESSRKQTFIDRCLLLADCCIDMQARTDDKSSGRSYAYVTEADYLNPESKWNFLAESEYIHPHLYYLKRQETENGLIVTHNLLEVIEPTLPRYSLRKKIKNYVSFLNSDEWDGITRELAAEELPVILIVCPTKAELIYTKRSAKKELADIYGDGEEDIPEDIYIRFTTVEIIRFHGVTGKIWEDI
jgi:Replication-relaxation